MINSYNGMWFSDFFFLNKLLSHHRRRKWQLTPVFLPEESMDRGAWWATVHRVAKSRTWLSDSAHKPPQWREGIFNAYCWVKDANLRRLCTVWFQLHDILEKTKVWRQNRGQWLPGIWGKEKRWVGRAQGVLGQWNYLYDTIMVDIERVMVGTRTYIFVKTHRMFNTKSEA